MGIFNDYMKTVEFLEEKEKNLRKMKMCLVCGDNKPEGNLICWSCWKVYRKASDLLDQFIYGTTENKTS